MLSLQLCMVLRELYNRFGITGCVGVGVEVFFKKMFMALELTKDENQAEPLPVLVFMVVPK